MFILICVFNVIYSVCSVMTPQCCEILGGVVCSLCVAMLACNALICVFICIELGLHLNGIV